MNTKHSWMVYDDIIRCRHCGLNIREPLAWDGSGEHVYTCLSPASIKQPPSTPGDIEVLPFVLRALEDRRDVGVIKHGHALGTNNGRDATMDALQEALDLVMYLGQKYLEEQDGNVLH